MKGPQILFFLQFTFQFIYIASFKLLNEIEQKKKKEERIRKKRK